MIPAHLRTRAGVRATLTRHAQVTGHRAGTEPRGGTEPRHLVEPAPRGQRLARRGADRGERPRHLEHRHRQQRGKGQDRGGKRPGA